MSASQKRLSEATARKTKYPKFYGGTLDVETGELYDARKTPPKPMSPKVKAERRAKAKAAKKARKGARRRCRA
jgi:hypothetical protein